MKVLLGKKLGMTTIFDDAGRSLGVTAVEVWPATVLRLRTAQKDGYEAMQLGAGTAKAPRGSKTPRKTAVGNGGGTAYAVIKEFPLVTVGEGDDGPAIAPGATLGIDQLEAGERLTVTAASKGKGFQGTVKRHNFSRGPKSHGSRNYRAPGSIGGTGAARVFPGQKMPGRMGATPVTTLGLKVAAVRTDENVVLLTGSVPGPVGSLVTMRSR